MKQFNLKKEDYYAEGWKLYNTTIFTFSLVGVISVHPAIHDNLCCNFRINLDIIKNMFLRNPYRSHFHQLQNRKKRNDHFHFR